jgi:hypothetical protein
MTKFTNDLIHEGMTAAPQDAFAGRGCDDPIHTATARIGVMHFT